MGLTLEPDVVTTAANHADTTGGDVTGYGKQFTRTDDVVAKHGSMSSAQALSACRSGWSGRITGDGGLVTTLGQDMHTAVKNYLATDQQNATDIRHGGRMRPI